MYLTREEILEIAERKGHFFVGPKWRNDGVRRICNKLVRKGLLRKDGNWRKYGRFGDWYFPVKHED